jgi:hypothetical protein
MWSGIQHDESYRFDLPNLSPRTFPAWETALQAEGSTEVMRTFTSSDYMHKKAIARETCFPHPTTKSKECLFTTNA